MNGTANNEMRCNTVYTQTTADPVRNLSSLTAPQIKALGPVICIDNRNPAPTAPARPSPTVGAVNLPANIDLSGVTIIADGNIHFGNITSCTSGPAGSLEGVKLISKFGGVWMNKVTANNLTVFSGDDDGNTSTADPGANTCPGGSTKPYYLISNQYDLRGYTTIASAANIVFEGKSYVTSSVGVADALTISVISSGDITNSGTYDYYGTFWAGGTFNQSGEAVIYGTVTTVGDVVISGRLKIRNMYKIDNPYLVGDVATVSRR